MFFFICFFFFWGGGGEGGEGDARVSDYFLQRIQMYLWGRWGGVGVGEGG